MREKEKVRKLCQKRRHREEKRKEGNRKNEGDENSV